MMRLLIYLPLVFFVGLIHKNWLSEYEVKDEHRGLSHSLFGIFLSVFIAGSYILLFKIVIESFPQIAIIPFMASFFLGAIIHLAQDSSTKSGIRWLYPFKQTLVSGNHSAFNSGDQRPRYLSIILIIFNLFSFFFLFREYPKSAPLVGFAFLIIAYFLFFKICKTKIKP